MISVSHNPNTYLNSYLSITRSMMVTVALSLGLITYSSKSNIFDEYHVKYLSMGMLLFAIIYGLKGGEDFKKYTIFLEKKLKENKKMTNRDVYLLEIPSWKKWIDLTNVYILILISVEIFLLYKVFYKSSI